MEEKKVKFPIVEINEDEAQKLKIKLIMKRQSYADWVREKIKEEIEKK